MLEKIQIDSPDHPLFPELWSAYQAVFPAEEKRRHADQLQTFSHPAYRLRAWVNAAKEMAGFVSWWEHPQFTFAEHFAISPHRQSGGLGSRIFRDWISSAPAPVILEIEPPADETTIRRLRFYQRLGFVQNNHTHFQPPYQPGHAPLPLHILSFPQPVSSALYETFAAFQRAEIMPRFS